MVEGNLNRDLQDYGDYDKIENSYYNRDSAVETVLPDEAEVWFERSGGYQGVWTMIVKFDRSWWVSCGGYGSCSGCDRFLGGHKVEETKRILREAYAFRTFEECQKYVEEKDRSWEEYPVPIKNNNEITFE